MDYLIYLSKSKVETLYAQLSPGMAQQLAAEIGASIGVLSAKIKTNPVVLSLYEKARIVEAQIAKTCGFGSLSAPSDWIKDTWEVRFIDPGTSFTRDMFLLVGAHMASGDQSSYFLLGGSAQNVVGNESASSVPTGLSYLPYFLHAFNVAFAEWEQTVSAKNVWSDSEPPRIRHSSGNELALSVRELYDASSTVSAMKVEFVARRLAKETSQSGRTNSSVYSPLYVALAG